MINKNVTIGDAQGHGMMKKSKAYGLVGAIAFAGALVLANNSVKADEVTSSPSDTEAVDVSLENQVTTENAAEASTAETSATVVVEDPALKNAVDDANSAGIPIKQTGTTDLGTAKTQEEVDALQKKAEEDQQSQAATITQAIKDAKTAGDAAEPVEDANKQADQLIKNAADAGLTATVSTKKISSKDEVDTSKYAKTQADIDKYVADKKLYDAQVADAKANSTKDGYTSDIVNQDLVFKSEPDSTIVSVSTTSSGALIKSTDDAATISSVADHYDRITGSNQSRSGATYADIVRNGGTAVVLKKVGDSVTVTNSDLKNSRVGDTLIASIKTVYTLTKHTKSNNSKAPQTDDVLLVVYKDPTRSARTTVSAGTVEYDIAYTYYDAAGNEISLKDKNIVLGVSSLNHDDTYIYGEMLDSYEYADVSGTGGKIISINGSSVTTHSDGRAYSDTNNGQKGLNGANAAGQTEHPNWDSTSSNDFWFGSTGVVYSNLSSNTVHVKVGAVSRQETWFAINSSVATRSVVDVPKKPDVNVTKYEVKVTNNNVNYNLSSYTKIGSVVVDNMIAGTTTKLTATTNLVTDQPVGTSYSAEHTDTITTADGKIYQYVSSTDNTKGTVALGTKQVINYYKLLQGDVVVDYKSTTGQTLQARVTDTPTTDTGTSYDTTDNKPGIITTADGKTYKIVPSKTQGSETGKVVPGTTNVTYIYEEFTTTPVKTGTNSSGEDVNGKQMLKGDTQIYTITSDNDDYKDVSGLTTAQKAAKGYLFDDYDEGVVTPNMAAARAVDTASSTVLNGATVTQYNSVSDAPQEIQDIIKAYNINISGAFVVGVNSQDYYANYVSQGKNWSLILPVTINKDTNATEYKNQAIQVDFVGAKVTNIITNTLPKIDPKKDVVVSVQDGLNNQNSINGKSVTVGDTYNFEIDGSILDGNRGTDVKSYVITDTLSKLVQYDGVHKWYAKVDIRLTDGTVIKAGDDLSQYMSQTIDRDTNKVKFVFSEEFLSKLDRNSQFGLTGYIQVTQIAAGTVKNVYTETVNDVDGESNEVTVEAKEKPEPPKDNPQPKLEGTPVQAAAILPVTGESNSPAISILGLLALGLAAIGFKKTTRKQED